MFKQDTGVSQVIPPLKEPTSKVVRRNEWNAADVFFAGQTKFQKDMVRHVSHLLREYLDVTCMCRFPEQVFIVETFFAPSVRRAYWGWGEKEKEVAQGQAPGPQEEGEDPPERAPGRAPSPWPSWRKGRWRRKSE